MKENILIEKSIVFAARIIKLHDYLTTIHYSFSPFPIFPLEILREGWYNIFVWPCAKQISK